MYKDVDAALEKARKRTRDTRQLASSNWFGEVSIGQILREIQEEAKGLAARSVTKAPLTTLAESAPASPPLRDPLSIRILRRMERTIKPRASTAHKVFTPVPQEPVPEGQVRVVWAGDILRYDGEQFVRAAYHLLLFRSPERQAVENIAASLLEGSISKVGVLDVIAASQECKVHGILLAGMWRRRLAESVKNRLYWVPVLGYALRWASAVVTLPSKFALVRQYLGDLNNRQRGANDGLDAVMGSVHTLDHQRRQMADASGSLANRMLKVEARTVREFRQLRAQFEQDQQALRQLDLQADQTQQALRQLDLQVIQNRQTLRQMEDAENQQRDEARQRRDQEKEIMDYFYLRYNEVVMKDKREDVKKRASVHLESLRTWSQGKDPARLAMVDLGCGTCEWVEALNENGYPIVGIDSNHKVVEKVRKNYPNIRIEEDEAYAFLCKQPDESLDFISAFHMVEHIEIIHLIELIQTCYRVLKKGGMLILETPNPQNILTSTYYFYLDPTHRKPLPPELLEYLVTECKFSLVKRELLYPMDYCDYDMHTDDPIKHIVFRFNMEQSYAVLAVKE